jgi:hypothetical protein
MEGQGRWSSGLSLVAGLWLVFSPLWIHYSVSGNAWVQVIVGIAISLLAIVRMAAPDVAWPSWVNLVAGLYFIVAPWIIHTSSAARWNQVILGVIVTGLSALSLSARTTAEEGANQATATRQAAEGFYERVGRESKRR